MTTKAEETTEVTTEEPTEVTTEAAIDESLYKAAYKEVLESYKTQIDNYFWSMNMIIPQRLKRRTDTDRICRCYR